MLVEAFLEDGSIKELTPKALIVSSERGDPVLVIRVVEKDIYQISMVGDEDFDATIGKITGSAPEAEVVKKKL